MEKEEILLKDLNQIEETDLIEKDLNQIEKDLNQIEKDLNQILQKDTN